MPTDEKLAVDESLHELAGSHQRRKAPTMIDKPTSQPSDGPAAGAASELDVLGATEAERLALCDFLDGLDEAAWGTQSWCDAWTVRQVVAHLTTSTRTGLWDMISGAFAARGNFDKMERDRAVRLADAFSPAELMQQIKVTASSAKRAPMSDQLDPLVDFIVHGQDIARPLDAQLETHPGRAKAALDHVVSSRWYGAPKRFADLNLTATDIEWSHGQGTGYVNGRAIDLLLVATGRAQALTELTGSGVATLTGRMSE